MSDVQAVCRVNSVFPLLINTTGKRVFQTGRAIGIVAYYVCRCIVWKRNFSPLSRGSFALTFLGSELLKLKIVL